MDVTRRNVCEDTFSILFADHAEAISNIFEENTKGRQS